MQGIVAAGPYPAALHIHWPVQPMADLLGESPGRGPMLMLKEIDTLSGSTVCLAFWNDMPVDMFQSNASAGQTLSFAECEAHWCWL